MLIRVCEYAICSLCVHLFALFSLCFYYADYFRYSSPILAEYDYIIVGSGTAGSLIAYRLSTETKHSYVVLEAGAHRNFLTNIPVLGPLLQGSVYDWGYETSPQENTCGSMKGQKSKWPRGKIVGGSAILNNMIHVRGNLTHYVDWFQGKYSKEYIENQFKFLEKNMLYVDHLKFNSLLADTVLEAASEIGCEIKDLNEVFGLGFMKSSVNQKDGSRWSTSHKLARNLVTDTVVDKILINNKNIAYGVEYDQNGKIGTARARKGVIVASGAINSPKLLLLSGIGPEEHLNEMGVPLVKDLPVGRNLQDHITTGLDLIHFNQSLNLGPGDMINPLNILSYLFRGRGPFTSPGCEVIGILSTNKTLSADLQFMVLPVGVTYDRGAHLKNSVGIKDNVWNEYFAKILNVQTASILPILLHPKSKGEIKLQTKSPKDFPVINPEYLTEKEDVNILVNGLEIIKKLVNTKSMRRLGAHLNPQHYPNCEHFQIFSKPYWECYVRELTLTTYHPIGTCKMGPEGSQSSVVNTNFEVIGVNRLYVADGSVLPTIPSGNVNAAIAMMANIFFNAHFGNKTVLSDSNTCQRMDMIFSFYLRICALKNVRTQTRHRA